MAVRDATQMDRPRVAVDSPDILGIFGNADAALAWSRRLADISTILFHHGFDLAAEDVLGASVTLASEARDDLVA